MQRDLLMFALIKLLALFNAQKACHKLFWATFHTH